MSQQSARFRFIHVSDLHIGQVANQENVIQLARERRNSPISDVVAADRGPSPYSRTILGLNSHDDSVLKYLAAFCYDRRDDVNAFLFTGDLARTGMRGDMTAASNFFRLNVKEHFFKPNGDVSIASVKRKKYILPGNHDRYKNQLGFVNSTMFDSSFLDLYPGGERVYSGTGGEGAKSIGLVFVDFSFSKSSQPLNHEHLYGGGMVTGEILGRVIEETEKLKKSRPGIFVIWVSHFAPFDCGDDLSLTGYDKFLDAADKSNIKLILCGHTHKISNARYNDTTILCAGSATCVDSRGKNVVHILDIKIGSQIRLQREHYHFDLTLRDFVRNKRVEKYVL